MVELGLVVDELVPDRALRVEADEERVVRIMLLRDGAIEVFEDREVVLNAIRRRSLRPVATESEAAESDATGATS